MAIPTVLARVQAERGALQHGGILANVPDVEVDKDGQGGKHRHTQPGQHEDVRQHDELKQDISLMPNQYVHFLIICTKENVQRSQERLLIQ